MYDAFSRLPGLQTPSLTGVGAIRGRFLNALSGLSTRLVGAMSYGSPSSRWQTVNLSAGLSGYLGAGRVTPAQDAPRLAPAQSGPVQGDVATYQANWTAGGQHSYWHTLGGRTPTLNSQSEAASFTGGRATPSDANLGYQTGSSVPAESQGSTITSLPMPPGQPGTPSTPAQPVNPGVPESPGVPPMPQPNPDLGAPATGIPGSYLDNGNPSTGIPSAYTDPLGSGGMPNLGTPSTGIPGAYLDNGSPSTGIPGAYLDNGNPSTGIPGGYPGVPSTGIPGGYPGVPSIGIPGGYPGVPSTGIPGGYPGVPSTGIPGGYPGVPSAAIPGSYPFFYM